jgi:hypothetical protein
VKIVVTVVVMMAVGVLLVSSPAFSAESTRGPTSVVVSDADSAFSCLNSLDCPANVAAATGEECSEPLSQQIAGNAMSYASATATIGDQSVSAVRENSQQVIAVERVAVAALSRRYENYPLELSAQLLPAVFASPEEVARSGTTFSGVKGMNGLAYPIASDFSGCGRVGDVPDNV